VDGADRGWSPGREAERTGPAGGSAAPTQTARRRAGCTRRGGRCRRRLPHRPDGDLDALTAEWIRAVIRDHAIAEDLRRFTGSLHRQTTVDAAAALPRFTKPALIAWSADDAFFPQEDGRRLAEALPNARLEVIEGARTFSMLDQPDVLASLIAEFATQTRPVARGAEWDRC